MDSPCGCKCNPVIEMLGVVKVAPRCMLLDRWQKPFAVHSPSNVQLQQHTSVRKRSFLRAGMAWARALPLHVPGLHWQGI